MTSPGLDNVVAASTRLSEVDGEAGRLTIAGYAVENIKSSDKGVLDVGALEHIVNSDVAALDRRRIRTSHRNFCNPPDADDRRIGGCALRTNSYHAAEENDEGSCCRQALDHQECSLTRQSMSVPTDRNS
jgi:hypothetical protein